LHNQSKKLNVQTDIFIPKQKKQDLEGTNIQDSGRFIIPKYLQNSEDYQDITAFYPIYIKEKEKEDEDEERLDNTLTLDNSIGEASRKK